MNSDSDSDLEFVAGLQKKQLSGNAPKRKTSSKQPSAVPNHAQEVGVESSGNADFTRIYWEKLGENDILRSQLNKNQAEHQRHLAEILAKQTRDKDEHKREIEEMKRSVERERIQQQFLLAELRMKNANGGPSLGNDAALNSLPNLPTGTRSSDQSVVASLQQQAPSRTRPAASADFSDGFVLKKPRITPPASSFSVTSSSHLSNAPTSTFPSPTEPISSNPSDASQLMAFLVNHRAPNFQKSSLQLLFNYKIADSSPNESSSAPGAPSIGQDLMLSLSLGELADKTMRYIENLSVSLDSDHIELLLSILYDSFYLDLPWSFQKSKLPKRLCDLLVFWVKECRPLPQFSEFRKDNTVKIMDVRRLTCITYTLDVLLAADWGFEISYDMCRRVMALGHAPQLCSRIVELMAVHPQAEFSTLLTIQLPMIQAEPSAELLFSGLSDKPALSAALLSRRAVPHSRICSFAKTLDDIDELEETASRVARTFFEQTQVASIRLADALVRHGSALPSIDQHVLGLLTRSVDTFILHPHSELVKLSVFYLWCRDYTSLRRNLDASFLTELCVCLAKLVHDCTDDTWNVVEQARQLLQVLTSSEELDRLLEVFEPLESESMDEEDPDLMMD